MNWQLFIYATIVFLIIGSVIGYIIAKAVTRVIWRRRREMYRKTKNPYYLR